MRGLKESGQAVGAETLTALADFAPPTILSQAARIQAVQRLFNLTVTNVPGPQFPLYLLGRPLARLYPLVPIVENAALGIAIMSYNGRIDFGLVADYDALPDLDDVAAALDGAIGELAVLAGAVGQAARAAGARQAARLTESAPWPARSHRSPLRSRRSTRRSATSRATRGSCARTSRGHAKPAPSWCCSRSWC